MNYGTQDSLLEKLQAYADMDYYPFHMPGHKRRMPCGPEEYRGVSRMDITEIDGFDNLHDAEGILKKSMEQAAEVFGARHALFSVNGSSAGILTAVSAAVPFGGTILTARNCHKAVYHAIYLRRLKPVFLYPDTVDHFGIADAIRPEQVKEALIRHPDIKAVLLTSPTYDGIVSDVEAIAQIAHEKGIPCIVDAAHGAHFGFHPGFPESVNRQGADLVIASLHKTLPALTQTAMVFANSDRVSWEEVERFSRIYQTSSPSYLLMGSIDACTAYLKEQEENLWDEIFLALDDFFQKTKKLHLFEIITKDKLIQAGSCMKDFDVGKLLISTKKAGISGHALYRRLLENAHLQMEMAADTYVTAILSCCDKKEGLDRLASALIQIESKLDAEGSFFEEEERIKQMPAEVYPQPEEAIPMAEALDGAKEKVPFSDAEGRISGTWINLYPPGIPLILPGERISKQVLTLIDSYRRQGLSVQGIGDGDFSIIVLEGEKR